MKILFIIWLLDVLPTIKAILILIGGIVIFWVGLCAIYTETPPKIWLITPILLLILGALLPNKETTYTMAAAYEVSVIMESERVNELSSDGVDVLRSWLKKSKTEFERSSEQIE